MAANKLTAHAVRDAGQGRHADGAGLYLDVGKTGAKRWTLITAVNKKRTEIGLGSASALSLREARLEAARLRATARSGGDPLAERRRSTDRETVTFGAFADELLAELLVEFRSKPHRDQWRYSLSTHCARLRPRPIDRISTDDVIETLKPMWTASPETASRTRGRIERVLDAAAARGLRSGENPARWKGHLATLLPKPKKLQRGHHAAMPWRDVPAFYARLLERTEPSARLFRFLILTAARSGEARGARWSEIDLDRAVWTVPADRIKAQVEHRVPLTDAMLEILEQMRGHHAELVFPSPRGKVFSDMVFKQLMTRMNVDGVTAHGFRSSFRDWADEAAQADWHVAEMCLAHRVGSAVERSYRRGDLLERRRSLLLKWSVFARGE